MRAKVKKFTTKITKVTKNPKSAETFFRFS